MEEAPQKKLDDEAKTNEKVILRANSSSSSSDDYEVIDNSNMIGETMEKVTPVLENLVSEDFIKDELNSAMINSPSSNVVGKSIFYDCMEEKSKFSDTDEGV